MSNPAQVLSRHRKTPLPPVVPARQAILSWTTGNQNGRCMLNLNNRKLFCHEIFIINKFGKTK